MFSDTATLKIDGINTMDFQNQKVVVDLEQSFSAEE